MGFCMGLYGTVWFCMVLYGAVWYCTHNTPNTMAYIPKKKPTIRPARTFVDRDERYNSTVWRRFSKSFLKINPMCAGVLNDGTPCTSLATVTDHIHPVSDGHGFWDNDFQPLCASCHNRKSAKSRHGKRIND